MQSYREPRGGGSAVDGTGEVRLPADAGKQQYPRPFSALRSLRGIMPEAKWNRVLNAFAPLGAEAISVDGWQSTI